MLTRGRLRSSRATPRVASAIPNPQILMPQQPQTFATHVRRPPAIYLAGTTVLVINAIYAAVLLFRNPGGVTLWQFVVAASLVMVALAVRSHSTRVQDRIIRLEERLRLSRILPEDLRDRVNDLTPAQMVALRFASDEEAPDLARRALSGEFQKSAEIKRQVKEWRGDYFRV